MRHFMPDQGVVQLIARSHVNYAPERRPALKATDFHVKQDWAFGGADHGLAAAL